LPAEQFREGQIVARVAAPQNLEKQEAERRHLEHDSPGMQFPFLHQMKLILADVLAAEQVRGAMEVSGEPPDGTDVGTCGSLGVITALEFLEHPFAKLGHRDLLVTLKILPPRDGRYPCHDA
jgi:hypothetical protein